MCLSRATSLMLLFDTASLSASDFESACAQTAASPDIFLKAAEMLGAKPSETAVFEDSIHAVLSAKSAGFKVIGVYDKLCPEEFDEIEKYADMSVKSFKELL